MALKKLLSLGRAFWDSSVLLVSANIKIFDHLKDFVSVEDVAPAVKLKIRTTKMLLDALSALKILEKQKETYRLAKEYAPYLLSSSDKNIISILNHYYFMFEDWAKLKDALVSDRPIKRERKKSKEEYYEFIRGMDNLTKFFKDRVVDNINLEGAKSILDIGSGPATYLREILKKNRDIRGYILDLPEATEVAEEFLKKDGLLDRVTFIKGDIEEVDFKRGYDIILISQVLHSLNPVTARKAFEKSYNALNKKGKLYVHEFYVREDRTFPKDNVIFSLNMLLHSDGGDNFTLSQLKSLYKESGFVNIKVTKFRNPYTVLVVGEKNY